jgi:aminoglycoside phosphotransferase (APT) family kinase protein
MARGVSTPVYRVRRGGETYYLRLAENAEASLEPEVRVHALLRARGVCVPEVVWFEPFDPALGRSAMLTTEIPGASLAESHEGVDVRAVLREAGRDVAAINGVPVEGFGWVRRDRPGADRPEGEHGDYRSWRLEGLEEQLARLTGRFQRPEEAEAVREIIVRHGPWLDVPEGRLAHGDLDATHVYHDAGRYSGIIDFGEIRGAEPWYDLGHYRAHDGESLPDETLPWLIEGYAEVAPLPDHPDRRIALSSLLIAVRALSRAADRPATAYQRRLKRAIRRDLALLGG